RTQRCRVIYIAAEAGKGLRNRVTAWAREKAGEEADPKFETVVSPVNLCDLKMSDADRLAEEVARRGGADLLIVDTVSRALQGGDENSPKDMGTLVATLDRLRERLG